MSDNDRQIARDAAKNLLAWADGATLEWASGGVDIPHPQFLALHVLAGNTVRIRPPAEPPEPKPSLPCPPRPTDEQVAAARLNGKRVRLVGVCEEPNGRPWFSIRDCALMSPSCSPIDDAACGARRWIAEVIEDEPRPWDLDPKHAGKVVVRKDGNGWGVITGCAYGVFYIGGWCGLKPAELLRDWTHNGQPCGDVS